MDRAYVLGDVRPGKGGEYGKNTDPDSCVGCGDEQTSSKWTSKLVKPTGGRCSARVHFFFRCSGDSSVL